MSDKITHYLDDFLFASLAGTWECARLLNVFQELVVEPRVLQVEERCEGLTHYLPIIFNTETDILAETCRLPRDKSESIWYTEGRCPHMACICSKV